MGIGRARRLDHWGNHRRRGRAVRLVLLASVEHVDHHEFDDDDNAARIELELGLDRAEEQLLVDVDQPALTDARGRAEYSSFPRASRSACASVARQRAGRRVFRQPTYERVAHPLRDDAAEEAL